MLSREEIAEIEAKIGYQPIRRAREHNLSDYTCARCDNIIWEGGGLFFRPRNKTKWIVFCRVDCACMAIGKDNALRLLTLEKYISKIMLEKPK